MNYMKMFEQLEPTSKHHSAYLTRMAIKLQKIVRGFLARRFAKAKRDSKEMEEASLLYKKIMGTNDDDD